MKDLLNYQKKLCFMKIPSVLMIIRPKLNYHSYSFLLKKYLFKLKMYFYWLLKTNIWRKYSNNIWHSKLPQIEYEYQYLE